LFFLASLLSTPYLRELRPLPSLLALEFKHLFKLGFSWCKFWIDSFWFWCWIEISLMKYLFRP
jgi:hypothetical protein